MDKNALKNNILSFLPEIELLEENDSINEFLNIIVKKEKLYDLCVYLKNNKDTSFDYMFCQSGIDWEEYLEVIYHLKSTKHNHEIVIRTRVPDKENANLDSVYNVWKTADFHEREIYDLLGIKFNHHPDLRRIFLDEDWEGFPLRKDYKDDINIVEL